MYDLLSADAQAGTPRDVFVRRYANIHDGIGELKLVARPRPAAISIRPPVRSRFTVTRSLSAFTATCRRTTSCRLPRNRRRVESRVAAGSDLQRSDRHVHRALLPDVPKRGRILDRNGQTAGRQRLDPAGRRRSGRDQGRGRAAGTACPTRWACRRPRSSSAIRAASRRGSCRSSSGPNRSGTISKRKWAASPASRCRTSRRGSTRSVRPRPTWSATSAHPTADELRAARAAGLRRYRLDRPRRHRGLGRAAPGRHARRPDPDRRFTGRRRARTSRAKRRRPGQDVHADARRRDPAGRG